jgi:hypothetical protein
MKQYINPSYSRSNNSFKHSFLLVFNKIETVLFSFLCVVFLIASQVNDDFRKNVSAVFINISLPVAEVVALPFNMTIERIKISKMNYKNYKIFI